MSAQPFVASESALVEAVARRVVDLLREEGKLAPNGPRLMTVAEVRDEFGLSADWVYANAERLGAIRLGPGPRARIRFDRATIVARLARLASRDGMPRSARRSQPEQHDNGELLPIRGDRA
jgi:hypothetical protein